MAPRRIGLNANVVMKIYLQRSKASMAADNKLSTGFAAAGGMEVEQPAAAKAQAILGSSFSGECRKQASCMLPGLIGTSRNLIASMC